MEANYLRFRQQLCKGVECLYEQDIFYFPPKSNVHSKSPYQNPYKDSNINPYRIRAYIPDFKIKIGKHVHYVETKGYMDTLSKEKLRLFKYYYPHLKLYLVTGKEYELIRKLYSHRIKNWE